MVRKTVAGHFSVMAKMRDRKMTSTVAKNVATGTDRDGTSSAYTSQPAPPQMPQKP